MVDFNKSKDMINSMIGEGTTIKGEIISAGSLFVSGAVEGTINIESDVLISEKGKVVGNIIGGKVVVSGTVDGDIQAKKGLEITKTGKVNGEIFADKLFIEDGSSYQGKVNVGKAPASQQ